MLLVGCHAPADGAPKPDPATAGADDTGESSSLAAPEPSLDAAGVEAEVASLVGDALPDAASLLEHWRGLFVGAGTPCPAVTGPFSIAAPFEGCLASDGRTWAGFAVYAEGRDAAVDVELAADATIIGTDGLTFLAAGQVTLAIEDDGAFASMVVGTWGGADADDWTDPRPSVGFWAEGTPSTATLFGGISLENRAVYIDDARWDATSCPGGSGRVRVRDPGGWWYTIALDADCGGCGPLAYEGTDLGTACVDLGVAIEAMVARTEEVR